MLVLGWIYFYKHFGDNQPAENDVKILPVLVWL